MADEAISCDPGLRSYDSEMPLTRVPGGSVKTCLWIWPAISKGPDVVTDFDIADLGRTSQHGRNSEAVDLTLTWLQTRALSLSSQTDHQKLILA